MRKGAFLVCLSLVLSGCTVENIPDPNDPSKVSIVQPKVMMRKLHWASDSANSRVEKGEITKEKAKSLVAETAEKMVSSIPMAKVPPKDAWEYAEVCRTARQWKAAIPLFEVAIKNAPTEDRRINDSLRLASCQAELGMVKEAIATARTVLNAKPQDSAPLLPSVLYEIVPPCRGKGQDAELAKLLRQTMKVWNNTIVDGSTQAGQAFTLAKPHHMSKADGLASELEADKTFEIQT